jgi:hypothetical protein
LERRGPYRDDALATVSGTRCSGIHGDRVLAIKSFAVTKRIQSRINSEVDLTRLEDWLVTAVTAKAIGDVIRDG